MLMSLAWGYVGMFPLVFQDGIKSDKNIKKTALKDGNQAGKNDEFTSPRISQEVAR